MIDLTGRVILVTGGSRGIGAVIVRTLAHAGAHVVLHYGQHRDAAQAVAADVPPGRCHLVHADLSVPGAATDLWKDSVAWREHIDVVVNNAAVATTARIEDPAEQWQAMWRETLQVNVMAVADICREALLHYRTRGAGRSSTSRAAPRSGAMSPTTCTTRHPRARSWH